MLEHYLTQPRISIAEVWLIFLFSYFVLKQFNIGVMGVPLLDFELIRVHTYFLILCLLMALTR
mgnify:FL=1